MSAPVPPPQLSTLQRLALQVLYGARNGAIYGVRVRLPHSLLLTAYVSHVEPPAGRMPH